MRQPFVSQEGMMGKANFVLSFDRRHLLTSAAGVTATTIVPGVKRTEAALVESVESAALAPEAPTLNVCAATARRLLEIARRNRIRREAGLPLLSIPRELRRMKQQEELEEFTRFEAVHAKAVWDQLLKPRRAAEGNPNWRPSWMEGVRYQNELYAALRAQIAKV
jgi:hypothetical protein